ncbi:MAG: ABC transporter substrate-binding protein [Myxococcota bacterium]
MRSVGMLNTALLCVAITTSAWLTWTFATDAGDAKTDDAASEPARFTIDADEVEVPVGPYARIVSASTIADQVLIRLIEPSRILAVSRHSLQGPDDPWRYEGKAGIGRAEDLEKIIALQPDLVFINGFVDVRHVQRMKEAGLTVFNLGEMRGVETFLPNIIEVASVLGVPERGEVMAREFSRRLSSVAADIPRDARERALYVGIHGDRLYGGTAGTSFHDVLEAAGLIDVAAEAGLRDWPAYSSEQLLSLDPPWIITNDKSETVLCRHPGFTKLSACQNKRVRGVDTDLLTDPGLGILRAAEAVHDTVYR